MALSVLNKIILFAVNVVCASCLAKPRAGDRLVKREAANSGHSGAALQQAAAPFLIRSEASDRSAPVVARLSAKGVVSAQEALEMSERRETSTSWQPLNGWQPSTSETNKLAASNQESLTFFNSEPRSNQKSSMWSDLKSRLPILQKQFNHFKFRLYAMGHRIRSAIDGTELDPTIQILIGCGTSFVLMLVFAAIKNRLYSPIPSRANSERMHVVYMESMERLQKLKQDLEDRRDELEALADGDDTDAMTRRQRERDQDARHKARNKEITDSASRVAQVPDKLKAQAEDVQKAFTAAVDSSRERFEDITKRETGAVYETLQQAVNERKVPDWDPPDWLAGDDEEVEIIKLPPLSNLIQGAFAPAQLQRMLANAEWAWISDLVLICITSVVLALEFEKPCKDELIWIWQIGILVTMSLDFLSRIVLIRWCWETRGDLKAGRQALAKENEVTTGNGILDSMSYMRRGGNTYFDAYFKYQELDTSWLAGFVRWLKLFGLMWGGFGLWISVHDVIVDELECQAKLAIRWMHTYSMLYVLMLTWSVMGLLFWIFGNISSSSVISTPVMMLARSIDDSSFKGFPVTLSLIESFVMENSANSIGMLTIEVRQDLADLTVDIQRKERKLIERHRARDRLREQASMGSSEQEFMERCQRKVTVALEQAKPFVGLLAANVKSDSPESANAGAGATAGSGSSSTQPQKGRRGSRQSRAHLGTQVEEEADQAEAAGSDVEDF